MLTQSGGGPELGTLLDSRVLVDSQNCVFPWFFMVRWLFQVFLISGWWIPWSLGADAPSELRPGDAGAQRSSSGACFSGGCGATSRHHQRLGLASYFLVFV